MEKTEKSKIKKLLHTENVAFIETGLSLWETFIIPDALDISKQNLEEMLGCTLEIDEEKEILKFDELIWQLKELFKYGLLIAAWLLNVLRDIFQLKLSHLKELCLNGESLEKLSELLNIMPQLEILCLEFCHLENLPEGLWQLNNLRELHLSNNKLSFISRNIACLTNLEKLHLSNNQLVDLPDEIGRLKKLRSLSVACNELEYLPDELGELQNLERLDIAHNFELERWFPDWIYSLKNLRSLDVASWANFDETKLTLNVVVFADSLDG